MHIPFSTSMPDHHQYFSFAVYMVQNHDMIYQPKATMASQTNFFTNNTISTP